MKRVLFIDLQNTARSQMAEAWFKEFVQGWAEARSCGIMPADRADPLTVVAMAEAGIDIRQQVPKAISQHLLSEADLVVTMGTDVYPHAFVPTHTWDFRDPSGQSIVHYRIQRDAIRQRVQEFIIEIQRAVGVQGEPDWTLGVLLQQQLLNEYLYVR